MNSFCWKQNLRKLYACFVSRIMMSMWLLSTYKFNSFPGEQHLIEQIESDRFELWVFPDVYIPTQVVWKWHEREITIVYIIHWNESTRRYCAGQDCIFSICLYKYIMYISFSRISICFMICYCNSLFNMLGPKAWGLPNISNVFTQIHNMNSLESRSYYNSCSVNFAILILSLLS